MSDFYNKYPYTDFHELNIDWVIERVKKLTEDWVATLEEWNNTEEQWQQLYDYVHDYFDNLDVQQEINNKINDMILDGTFATIVTPIINAKVGEALPGVVSVQIPAVVSSQIGGTVANQIGGTVAAQIGAAVVTPVNDWLTLHITQPTTPVVDNTLSITSAAADAKKVGDNTAIAYSSLNTYDAGNYVLYSGNLYRCISDITTPEAWDATHWTQVNAGNELNNANTGVDSVGHIDDVAFSWTNGKVIKSDGDFTNNPGWDYYIKEIKGETVLKIRGTFQQLSSSYFHVAFYNGLNPSADNLISGLLLAEGVNKIVNTWIPIPKNTRSVAICDAASVDSDVVFSLGDIFTVFNAVNDVTRLNYVINTQGRVNAVTSNIWYSSKIFNVEDNSNLVLPFDLYNTNSGSFRDVVFYDDYGNTVGGTNTAGADVSIPVNAKYGRYMAQAGNNSHYLLNYNSGIKHTVKRDFYRNIIENYDDFVWTDNGLTFTKTGNTITIVGTAASYNATCMVFPLECLIPGKSYNIHYNKPSGVFLQYFEDANAVKTLNANDDITVSNYQIDAYMRLLINTTVGNNYNVTVTIDIEEPVVEYEEYHITTASDLYNFFTNFSDDGRYKKVYLEAPSYDLYTGLYENYVDNDQMDFNLNSLYLNNVEIIGNGSTISLKIPEAKVLAHTSSCNTVSAFNVKGNVYIHDLIIDAENCRYCIHDESLSDSSLHYTVHRYENIIFKYNRSSSNVALVMQCIGIGGSLGQQYIFKNCKFLRTGVGGNGGCFYIHGRDYNIDSIDIENCIFTSTATSTFLLSQYTGNDKPTMVNIINSIIQGDITIKPQTNTGFNYQQWAVTTFNSNYTQIDAQDTGTWPLVLQPVECNSIDGTIT